ncbi:MAG: hypothetical protein IPM07_21015 [Anaerolineales bacterium]|nr:hypothetical protein [Anaerolineales bacterium]
MLPFAPTLFVRPLTPEDAEAACHLINRMLALSIYSRAMTPADVDAQFLEEAPPGVFTARWQKRSTFVLLRVGELVGLLDAAVGLDSESLDLPDFRRWGCCVSWCCLKIPLSATMPRLDCWPPRRNSGDAAAWAASRRIISAPAIPSGRPALGCCRPIGRSKSGC